MELELANLNAIANELHSRQLRWALIAMEYPPNKGEILAYSGTRRQAFELLQLGLSGISFSAWDSVPEWPVPPDDPGEK